MRAALPVLVAGATFAGAAVFGLFAGIAAAGRTGNPVLAPIGLMLGAAVGAYCAVRLLFRSLG
jgi:hypothetical protein